MPAVMRGQPKPKGGSRGRRGPAPSKAAPPLAYTTVSTMVRLLAQKGFVGHEAFGRTHRYRPLIRQDDYRRFILQRLLDAYFDGSFGALLGFYTRAASLDAAQLGQLVGQAYQQLGPALPAAEPGA